MSGELVAADAPGDLAVLGGTVHTAAGQVIADGVILIRKGKIERVGPRAEVPLPAGVPVVAAAGRVVIPGLVEVWAEGGGEGQEGGEVEHRAADGVEPSPALLRRALAEGITTLGFAPAPRKGLGGLGMVVKLRTADPRSPDEVLLRADSHLVLSLGMPAPGLGPPRISTADRLEQYYGLRQRFLAAREYRKGWDGYWEAVEKYNRGLAPRTAAAAAAAAAPAPGEGRADDRQAEDKKAGDEKAGDKKAEERKPEEAKPPKPPERPRLDLEKEALLRAIEGKLPVLLVAHQRSDLGYALRLKDEFGLDLTVAGATEGYRAAADLHAAKARALVGPALLSRWSLDLLEHRESNPRDLAAGGVAVALSALGGTAFPAPALRLEACVAVRGGLEPPRALRAITSEPAAVLGLSGSVGTIEPGMDGDLVILDGDPLSALSRVVRVVVEGRVVFEREAEL